MSYNLTQYKLAFLPNLPGFRFRGVTALGDLIPCVVKMDERTGLCTIENEVTGEKCFHQIVSWYQYNNR